ncbi:MAG: hypothetical protein K0M45_01745, partial [Candidatus Paracaedibacteraceae bacterium]|nr:hypothetical protein [Candidatus Paracaedibacteraceae bacterium]
MIKNFNAGVKSVPDWAGYVRQLTCQLLIASGLSLACLGSLEAMEKEDPLSFSTGTKTEEVKKRRRGHENKETFPIAKRPAIEASEQEEPLRPLKTITKIGVSAHPLTQAFWKDREPSDRLKKIRKDIEDITEKFINSSKDPISDLMKINSGRYRDILTCSQCDNRAADSLIDVHLCAFKGAWDQVKPNNIGCTNTSITILSRGPTNVIAIKTFKDTEETPNNIQEGLEELLYSLLAYRMNPSPSQLKMARIYDAILCPKNSLSLIMEGANAHDIHYFLATDLATSVVKACAQYLAKFHIGNYKKNKTLIKGKEYLSHKADPYHKTAYDPLKDDNELSLRLGKQRPHLKTVTSRNIIQLLSEEDQEHFAGLVKRNRERFKRNCEKIFRFLKGSRATGKPEFYFLTKTHGDAHGNNFFYNDEKGLTNSEGIIGADSFYRISMIDYASIIRTYGGFGDPAEDVGRFLGSLWDWAARSGNEAHSDYGRINGLQHEFLQAYRQVITDEGVLSPEQEKRFHKIFKENSTFYKFRFYKAIFNSTKDKETKLRLLRSWIQENANTEISLTRYILRGLPKDRPWQPVTERTLHWLPNHLEGFIESHEESGESYLTSLWRQFNSGIRTATISSTIAGMGGVGKTSLALAYAHEALENKGYHLIYWLLSETQSSLLKGYRDLLERINIVCKDEDDTLIIELIKEHLPRLGKCLLIYDNVPKPEFLKGKMPEASHIDILMTSRRSHGWEGDLVDLAVFRPEDSVKYLLQTIGFEDTRDNQAKVGELAEELGHLPLALSHAAHYIKLVRREEAPGDIIDKYIKKFRETPIGHFEKRQHPFESGKSAITHENLIEKTFQMSREKLSELAQRLMIYCAYLDPDQIIPEIFVQIGSSKEEIDTALSDLEAYSLIKRNRNTFSIHRLTQLVLREHQKQQSSKIINMILSNFYSYWKNHSRRTKEESLLEIYSKAMLVFPNLHKVAEHLYKYAAVNSDEVSLKNRLKVGYKLLTELFIDYRRFLRDKVLVSRKDSVKSKKLQEDRISLSLKIIQDEFKEEGIVLTLEESSTLYSTLLKNLTSDGRALLIRKLTEINNSKDRGELVRQASKLVTENMNWFCRFQIIDTLANIPDSQDRKEIVKQVSKLVTEDMPDDVSSALIVTLAGIPDKETREDISSYALKLFTRDMDGFRRSQIIEAITSIPDGKARKEILHQAPKLFTKEINWVSRVEIIKSLASIPDSQIIRDIIDQVTNLLAEDIDVHQRVEIIKSLVSIPESKNRKEVFDLAKNLFTKYAILRKNQLLVIKLLTVLPYGDSRREVASRFKELFKDLFMEEMEEDTVLEVILASIPDSETRREVAEQASELFKENMHWVHHLPIIKSLASIPDSETRREVANQALELFKVNPNSGSMIIKSLASIPDSETRREVANQALELFKVNPNSGSMIIESLASIPDSETRREVVEQASKLFTEDIDEVSQFHIILSLASIPDSETRRDIVKQTLKLFTKNMSGHGR